MCVCDRRLFCTFLHLPLLRLLWLWWLIRQLRVDFLSWEEVLLSSLNGWSVFEVDEAAHDCITQFSSEHRLPLRRNRRSMHSEQAYCAVDMLKYMWCDEPFHFMSGWPLCPSPLPASRRWFTPASPSSSTTMRVSSSESQCCFCVTRWFDQFFSNHISPERVCVYAFQFSVQLSSFFSFLTSDWKWALSFLLRYHHWIHHSWHKHWCFCFHLLIHQTFMLSGAADDDDSPGSSHFTSLISTDCCTALSFASSTH